MWHCLKKYKETWFCLHPAVPNKCSAFTPVGRQDKYFIITIATCIHSKHFAETIARGFGKCSGTDPPVMNKLAQLRWSHWNSMDLHQDLTLCLLRSFLSLFLFFLVEGNDLKLWFNHRTLYSLRRSHSAVVSAQSTQRPMFERSTWGTQQSHLSSSISAQ